VGSDSQRSAIHQFLNIRAIMDGFGDSFVPAAEGAAPPAEVDPAAEFLAREQDQLAGLEDDLAAVTVSAVPDTAGDSGDLFGSTPAAVTADAPVLVNGTADLESFEMLGGDEVAPASTTPIRSVTPTPVVREEPEKIKIWREEQLKRMEEKDKLEEQAKEELRLKAKAELEEWYKQHEEQVAKTRQANRSAEKELVAETSAIEPGTEWERISKLCDFNPKTAKSTRDISRMRSIILQVKQNPPVKA